MNRLLAPILLISIFCIGNSALAAEKCDAKNGAQMTSVSKAPFSVHVLITDGDVPLNAPFDAQIQICSQSDTFPSGIMVDATMPAHKHGMNYKANVKRINDHQYVVENLLFHMLGIWRLEVTAYKSNQPYRFTRDVKLQ